MVLSDHTKAQTLGGAEYGNIPKGTMLVIKKTTSDVSVYTMEKISDTFTFIYEENGKQHDIKVLRSDVEYYGEIDMFGNVRKIDKDWNRIENDYSDLMFDTSSGLLDDSQYLKYLGKITATDEKGNDLTDNILISEYGIDYAKNGLLIIVSIFVEDEKGNTLKKEVCMNLATIDLNEESITLEEQLPEGYEILSREPVVFGYPRKE